MFNHPSREQSICRRKDCKIKVCEPDHNAKITEIKGQFFIEIAELKNAK